MLVIQVQYLSLSKNVSHILTIKTILHSWHVLNMLDLEVDFESHCNHVFQDLHHWKNPNILLKNCKKINYYKIYYVQKIESPFGN